MLLCLKWETPFSSSFCFCSFRTKNLVVFFLLWTNMLLCVVWALGWNQPKNMIFYYWALENVDPYLTRACRTVHKCLRHNQKLWVWVVFSVTNFGWYQYSVLGRTKKKSANISSISIILAKIWKLAISAILTRSAIIWLNTRIWAEIDKFQQIHIFFPKNTHIADIFVSAWTGTKAMLPSQKSWSILPGLGTDMERRVRIRCVKHYILQIFVSYLCRVII